MIAKTRVQWILLVGFLRLVQQQSLGLRLAIDSRLNIGKRDCYTRMVIGSRFCEHFISTTEIAVPDRSRCEELCTKRGEDCKAFTFGVGRKGNATCTLAPEIPTVHDLQTHPDYDVYVKEQQSENCIKREDEFSKRLFQQSQDVWRCADPQCESIHDPESQNLPNYKPYPGVSPDITSQHYVYSNVHLANQPPQADGESWSGDIYTNEFQALPITASSTSDSPPSFGDESLKYSYPKELSIFRRYTVTGQACRNGTECEENQLAGFWACELERADDGTWDYCCAPRHQCGFTRDFQYPWYPMKLHWPSIYQKNRTVNANN